MPNCYCKKLLFSKLLGGCARPGRGVFTLPHLLSNETVALRTMAQVALLTMVGGRKTHLKVTLNITDFML